MGKLTLPLFLGTSRDFDLKADGPDDTFLDTDTLSTTVSIGRGQPSLLSPAITWLDAPTAQFRISFNDADTPGILSPGVYKIQAKATRAGRSGLILDARLQILAVPGTDSPIPVYTGYVDLEDHAPWIGDLQSDEDETWFLRQQGKAREWLDEIMVSRYDWGSMMPTIGTPGFGAWSMFGQGMDFAPSKWLRDQLAANVLIVQPKTLEICACRALFHICMPQLGKNGDVSYRTLGREFARRASDLVRTYRAELDLNGDGYADIIINCGSTSLR